MYATHPQREKELESQCAVLNMQEVVEAQRLEIVQAEETILGVSWACFC